MTIRVPQFPIDQRQVARGLDSAGELLFGQVGFTELSFEGLFGARLYSSTDATIALGKATLWLDYDDGRMVPGCVVQMTSLDDPDCWQYGLVTRKADLEIDLSVALTSQLKCSGRNWELQTISGPALGLEADTTAVSATNVTVGLGEKTFTIQADKYFPEKSSVLARDLNTVGNYLYGQVVTLSGTSLVVDVSASAGSGSSGAWLIRLLDGPGVSNITEPEDWGSITSAAPGSPSGDEDYLFLAGALSATEDYAAITTAATSTADYGSVP